MKERCGSERLNNAGVASRHLRQPPRQSIVDKRWIKGGADDTSGATEAKGGGTCLLGPRAALGAVGAVLRATTRLDREKGTALDHRCVVVHAVDLGSHVHKIEEGRVVHVRDLLARPVGAHDA